jgi:hypothetical protein
MSKLLEQEFDFFLQHKEELFQQYPFKYISIKDKKIIGVYNDLAEAINETKKTYALGTFLVQFCDVNVNAYTATFHSRVCL